jgi:hypothetical protein
VAVEDFLQAGALVIRHAPTRDYAGLFRRRLIFSVDFDGRMARRAPPKPRELHNKAMCQ